MMWIIKSFGFIMIIYKAHFAKSQIQIFKVYLKENNSLSLKAKVKNTHFLPENIGN